MITFKNIKYAYFIVCLILTIGLSIYSVCRYIKNDDITSVRVAKFLSSKDSIYPAFSFCIFDPFLETKFEVFGDDDINVTYYKKFLEGEIWNDKMLKIENNNC